MGVVMLPIDASSGSPSYTAQQTRQAFAALAGPAPAGRPLGARSGVRLGTPTTTAFLSGGGSTTWNVGAHAGVLDTQTAAAAGPYFYATDGSDTGSITAADASNPRIDILYVKVNDTVQDGSGLRSGQVLYLAGTPAASPAPPATPARGMAIANISVPKSGTGSPTVSWVAPTFYPDTNLVQTGLVTGINGSVASPGLGSADVVITFPVPYSTPPTYVNGIVVNPGQSSGLDTKFQVVAYLGRGSNAPTTTGAHLTVVNMGSSSSAAYTGMSVAWTAIGTP